MSTAPEPVFEVIAATGRRHAAVPALDFDVHVSEPDGRSVYMIALSVQVMIEPARRRYADAERERLADLFGPPERWAMTTHSLVWHQVDVVVQTFTGATTFKVPIPVSYDLEVVAAKYFYGLEDGEVPLAFNFNGTVMYRGEDGGVQMSLVPWSCSAEFKMPVSAWRELIEHYYPRTGWIALHAETLDALRAEKVRRGLPTIDACVAELVAEGSALVAGA
jgi:hypothetical protein